MEKLENKVLDSNVENKDDMIAKIDELKADVASKAEEVASLTADTPKEDVRALLKEVKALWKDVRQTHKRITGALLNDKGGKLAGKHNGLLRSMEARIAAAAKRGHDTAALEEIKDRFEVHRDDVKAAHDAAKAAWKEEGDNDAWKAAQQEFREELKESKEILREFVAAFKDLRSDSDDVEEAEDTESESETTSEE